MQIVQNQKLMNQENGKLIINIMISEEDFNQAINECYTKGKRLGSGKDGEVYEYFHNINNAKFALKIISLFGDVEYQVEVYQKQNMRIILNPHPNIVRTLYFSIADDRSKFFIFMEKMEYTLKSEIERRRKNNFEYFSIDEYTNLFTSLIKTFAFLESLKIAHRDIKPDNLMFDENGVIKIVDL